MAWRPDTRSVWFVAIDSIPFMGTWEQFSKAQPKETAVCYRGILRDTLVMTVEGETLLVKALEITSVSGARIDSVSDHIYKTDNGWVEIQHIWTPYLSGCPDGTIATAHSHPMPNPDCELTHWDSDLLFADTRLLLTTAWCIDGRTITLFQDGRHYAGRWRTP